MEDQKKLKALLRLAEVFDANFMAARQDAYLDALAHVRAEHLEWACAEAVKRCEYFPVPKTLIELSNMVPRERVKQITAYTTGNHEEEKQQFDKLMEMINKMTEKMTI